MPGPHAGDVRVGKSHGYAGVAVALPLLLLVEVAIVNVRSR